jgi:nucleotide-binding universal stress UspA family protein
MKKIIALTDFSPESRHAVYYAADVALHLQAGLIIFHTVQHPENLAAAETDAQDLDYRLDNAAAFLSQLKTEIQEHTQHKISVASKFKIGKVEEELESVALHEKPFAVIMATRGLNSIERFFFKSNTLSVTRDNWFPVIVVPPLAFFNGFRKIAFTTDLEEDHLHAPLLPVDAWLQAFPTAQLDLLHVSEEPELSGTRLAALIGLKNHFQHYPSCFCHELNNNYQEGVYHYVETHHPELMIFQPKKHGLLHSSKSKPFILHPPVPVLVLPHSPETVVHGESALYEIY